MSDIDREVAEKVMGWMKDHESALWLDKITKQNVFYWYREADQWQREVQPLEIWSPSTRIDHVWEAVEKLRDDGFEVYIWWMPDRFEPGWAHARFVHQDQKERFEHQLPTGNAETAPLAICHALLAVVEGK